MRRPLDPLLRWLLGAILSLPIALAVWWQGIREPLIKGLAQAVDRVTPWLWSDTVLGIALSGERILLISLLPPLNDSAPLFVALPLSFNRAVVILPLFWGLTLATPGRGLLRRLLLGTLLLLPVAFVMGLLYAQFQIALYRTHLPTLTELPPIDYALALPDSPTIYYLWGLGRQMAVLVLPIVAPLLVWLLLHRSFLHKVIAGGLLQRLTRQVPLPPFNPEQ
jgi:hypothetical protein